MLKHLGAIKYIVIFMVLMILYFIIKDKDMKMKIDDNYFVYFKPKSRMPKVNVILPMNMKRNRLVKKVGLSSYL